MLPGLLPWWEEVRAGTLAFADGASYERRFRGGAINGQGVIPIQFQSDILCMKLDSKQAGKLKFMV